MKKIWYYALRAYVKFAYIFFYRKIRVAGGENIPPDLPVIFLPNHQNSFTDALMIAITNRRTIHYFARADVFQKPFLTWLMSTVNLRPIYRIRDGKEALKKNEEVFNLCYDALKRGESIMIHPEGTHSLKKRVRPISKGFARIAIGAREKYPELRIALIPVGINYGAPTKIGSDVSVHYGPAIKPEEFDYSIPEIRGKVEEYLKKLSLHIDDLNRHDELYSKLCEMGIDLTDPITGNETINRIGKEELTNYEGNKNHPWYYYPLLPLALINSFPLIFIWKIIKVKVRDPAFYGAIKFSIGLFFTPVLYFLLCWLVYGLWGWTTALIYLLLSLFAIRSLIMLESKKDYVMGYKSLRI